MTRKITTALVLMTGLFGNAYAQPNNSNQSQPNASNQQTAPQISNSVNTLSPKMRDALVHHISVEQYSSNLYLTFASYFADRGLDGCEAYFRESSEEEQEHALRFYNLLIDRNEQFQLKAVNASALMPTSVLDGFQKLLENEMRVSRAIRDLYTLALEERDYATQVFLHPFIAMQVEEEREAQDLVELLESGPNDPALILLFDNKVNAMAKHD